MTLQPIEADPTDNSAPAGQVSELMVWAQSARAASQVATSLAKTSFVPEAFRDKPDETTAAILAGSEVGLSPMAALRSFDIIQGTAAPRANTIRAIVQSRGHEVWVVESTDTRAVVAGRRRGTSQEQRSTWTIDRAKRLQLTGKKNWQNQPQAMLIARATTEVCRLIASDAILGLPYSVEELGDDIDSGGVTPTPTEEASPRRTAQRTTRRKTPELPAPSAPAEEPSNVTEEPAEQTGPPLPGEPGYDEPHTLITPPQLQMLHTTFTDLGVTDRDERLATASEVIGRHIISSKELTKDEASQLISTLTMRLAARDDDNPEATG